MSKKKPGVYVEEVSSGTRPLEGVGTAIAAFIGACAAVAAIVTVVRLKRRNS